MEHHLDPDEIHTLTSLPFLHIPHSALQLITHLRVSGLRLLDLTVLRDMPLLEDLTLDVVSSLRSSKEMYSEEEALCILGYLFEGGARLQHLRISVSKVGLDMLRGIVKRFPGLETLHLVGAGTCLPVTTQYATEATNLMVSLDLSALFYHLLAGPNVGRTAVRPLPVHFSLVSFPALFPRHPSAPGCTEPLPWLRRIPRFDLAHNPHTHYALVPHDQDSLHAPAQRRAGADAYWLDCAGV